MDNDQFQLFKSITLDYFSKLSPNGDKPVMEEPYMQFGGPKILEYTSLVEIDGQCHGCIYITSPVPILEEVLKLNGEPEISERTLRDMSRELSNVLAGNASNAFGGNWEISVPRSLVPEDFANLTLPDSTFVMPINWQGHRMFLVVGLSNPEENAT
jgi:hypothetical protein